VGSRTSRREFAALAFTALLPRRGMAAVTSQRVVLHTEVSVGQIRPELHGHFAEHLGSCTYGGLWVGRGSKIANINWHRKQAVDYLKALGIPVLRWPGGCFADDYHWRDGIGPAEKRPKRVNIHWGNYTEDNSFGTHEFVELCRLIDAEPYFAGNLGSGTPQEMRDWIEYCNYPSGSTLSDERAANGAREPFRIRYWGVGNENWGCGGDMTATEYAEHYRRFAVYLREFGGTRPYLIACGPNGNNLDWTRKFFDNIHTRRKPDGYAMHFYSNGRQTPLRFDREALEEQVATFARMERGVVQQRALMDSYDPDRKIGLLVDEWGVWDRMIPEEEKKFGRLFQQNTIRSAVAAMLGLNVFHRHADKLVMCNIAQIVNVLHAMLLTDEDRCIRTPSYYAFLLAKPHRGNTAIALETADTAPMAVSTSASRRGNQLVATFVNPKHDTSVELSCVLDGARAGAAAGRILHNADMNAANTFTAPDTVMPVDFRIETQGGGMRMTLPPLSIVTATVQLS
jgi:alpha-N-arabinofuranosidase